ESEESTPLDVTGNHQNPKKSFPRVRDFQSGEFSSSNLASSTIGDRDWLLRRNSLATNSVLTPRSAVSPIVGTATGAAMSHYRFSSVRLRMPIRPEPDGNWDQRTSKGPSVGSPNPEISNSPNQRQLLKDMLDPFTST
ncbi:MAG: hypothetical protein AAGG44_14520, partial [Planctomycetota bacterium]